MLFSAFLVPISYHNGNEMALWQSKSIVTCQKGGTTGKINVITKDSATSAFEESDDCNPVKPVQGSYFP